MTKNFIPLPSPHPEEKTLAPKLAAPLVGAIILAWTDIERDMNRNVLTWRLLKEWRHPPNRTLGPRFEDNLREWIAGFIDSDTAPADNDHIRTEAKRLKMIRDDLAHNIWALRLDQQLGIAINIVRENSKFYEDEKKWLSLVKKAGKRRVQQPRPEEFRTHTYIEADLNQALQDMYALASTMRQAEAAIMLKHAARNQP